MSWGSADTPRAGDDGSAIVEVLVLGVLLLVPLVYLILVLGRLQAASFAAEAAARDGARTVVAAGEEDQIEPRLQAVALLAAQDQGFAVDGQPGPDVALECSAQPCLQPDATVTVTVTIDVLLPAVPAVVDSVIPTRIPVQASSRGVVDRFRG